MFTGVPIFIAAVFIIVFGIIIFTVFKGVSVWSTNNRAPRETKKAFVLTKRTSTNHHVGGNQRSASTSYFVTFEFTNGNRKEFQVKGTEFGLMSEGDTGTLDFQGTRFHSFDRELTTSQQP
ncbi:DUF2500 domain-containing protein [Jeotgalibacillus sp. S-D1]|nr:DUF2500 domain-containing protein [Jeotgalibacillus sp. S-D1]